MNYPDLAKFCFGMIRRANKEDSKSNVATNASILQAINPCGNYSVNFSGISMCGWDIRSTYMRLSFGVSTTRRKPSRVGVGNWRFIFNSQVHSRQGFCSVDCFVPIGQPCRTLKQPPSTRTSTHKHLKCSCFFHSLGSSLNHYFLIAFTLSCSYGCFLLDIPGSDRIKLHKGFGVDQRCCLRRIANDWGPWNCRQCISASGPLLLRHGGEASYRKPRWRDQNYC